MDLFKVTQFKIATITINKSDQIIITKFSITEKSDSKFRRDLLNLVF